MLVFIDESGHPRPSDPTECPTILAACIQEEKLGSLSRATFALQRSLLSQMALNEVPFPSMLPILGSRRRLASFARPS